VLLCGVTGSGKSTTIASMLDYVNERKPVHIVTIEDPIEYIFEDKKATINQREIGIDCLDFKIALRALVRENPDIVLVGEMRDKETFEAALHAAETGHLVYGTIHASSTTQTFSRIYGLFEQEEVEQVRKILGVPDAGVRVSEAPADAAPEHPPHPGAGDPDQQRGRPQAHPRGSRGRAARVPQEHRARQRAWSTSTSRLWSSWRTEYIHMRVAMDSSPNVDELMMRLKKLGPSAPQSCKDGSYSFTFQVFHACFADCDQSGSLDINDFVCFQTLFATGDPAADCDGSETLNIDDFICFQTSFVLGC
jgi:twitching motility protein PilT